MKSSNVLLKRQEEGKVELLSLFESLAHPYVPSSNIFSFMA